MTFLKRIKPILIIFCVFGLSPCHAEYKSSKKRFTFRQISSLITNLACLTLVAYCLCSVNFRSFFGTSEIGPTQINVVNMNLVGALGRVISVLFQCIFYKNLFLEINFIFHQINLYFITHLQHNISYVRFRRQFVWRATIVVLAFLQYVIGHFMRTRYYLGFGSQLKILQAMAVANFLHITLYLDVLGYQLNALSAVIMRDMSNVSDAFVVQNKLHSFKIMHFRLWMVTQRINTVFGWTIIAILLHALADVVFCVFWLYETFRDPVNIFKMLSKSLCF